MLGKIVGIVLLALVIFGTYAWIKSGWIDTYIIEGTVKSKWIDVSSEGSHYLVRLTDNRMLEVNRNLFYGSNEFNPDIVYDDIQVNRTYYFTCWGWQWSFAEFYWYPYVLRAELK